jgi:hypothetical protein
MFESEREILHGPAEEESNGSALDGSRVNAGGAESSGEVGMLHGLHC